MPQLIVRNLEELVVRRLKERAGRNGVAAEEEHRRILRAVLLGREARRPSFRDFLRSIPDAGDDAFPERPRQRARPVRL